MHQALVSICQVPTIRKQAIEQHLQRREAEWTVNVNYLEAIIKEENLENIIFSYESLFQQQLQLDKLCDDLSKNNLTQNELKKIMGRSAERSLVVLMWKKYSKDYSREVTTDCDSLLPSAKEERNHSKLTVKIMNPQQPINPHKIGKKTYNLRDRSKADGSTDKVPTLSDSEKQQQNSRNTQHGRKNDDNKQQNNQLIGSAIHSGTTSLEGGDADNKDSNDKCNANS